MKKLFILVYCCIIVLPTIAQRNKPSTIDRFDAYVKNAMQLWKTPGLSVVIVKDKQVVFNKAYGVTEVGKPDPFLTSTESICASTTKAMTAVCMGMLVDEGKIKWTDKVSSVFPAFRLYDNYANNEITIKDLLTHNTGLGEDDWLWVLNDNVDTIIHQMQYIKPAYSFRSSFVYQNLMFIVAGEVIRHVAGKPWDQFIKERLFAPLGMNHTYPNHIQSLAEKSHITPHFMEDSVVKPIPLIEVKAVDAAGGVWSCTDDINKWMLFMLDSATVDGKRLLKPETFAELFKPQAIVTDDFYPTKKLTKPHWTTYGLGWYQEDYKGKMVQFHTGSLDGAVAIIGLIPDEHFGIYIFANMDHTEIRHALMYKAMDMFVLNDDKNDWSKDFYKMYNDFGIAAKKREAASYAKRAMNTKPSLPLKAYTGVYENEIYGRAEIMVQGDSLALKFPNSYILDLGHWNYDTFLGKYERTWNGKTLIQFDLNREAKVAQFNFEGLIYTKKEMAEKQ